MIYLSLSLFESFSPPNVDHLHELVQHRFTVLVTRPLHGLNEDA